VLLVFHLKPKLPVLMPKQDSDRLEDSLGMPDMTGCAVGAAYSATDVATRDARADAIRRCCAIGWYASAFTSISCKKVGQGVHC
jgi:hypothetical protein